MESATAPHVMNLERSFIIIQPKNIIALAAQLRSTAITERTHYAYLAMTYALKANILIRKLP